MKHLVLMMSALIFIGSSVSANSQLSEFSMKDVKTVQEAVEHITFTLEGQGFEIVMLVNFQIAAKSIGVKIRPTTVILATNSSLETSLIQRDQTSALDFPSKFLVFEDEEGAIQLEHSTVGALIDRHDLILKGEKLRKYGDLLDQFRSSKNGMVMVQSH